MVLRYIACLLLVGTLGILPAAAQPVETEHATVELLSETDKAVPGSTVLLALKLAPQPNWHTYWRNPGDSGMATKITWTLPEGFTAAEQEWQMPERIAIDPLTSYGYHGTSYHFSRITVPATVTEGQEYTLTAKADWLICEDICVPEHATLSITLTGAASASGGQGSNAEITEAYQKVPHDSVSASLRINGNTGELRFSPPAEMGAITGADFYAYVPGVTKHGPTPQWRTEGKETVIDVPLEEGQKPETLNGVAVLTLHDGVVRPVALETGPVTAPAPGQETPPAQPDGHALTHPEPAKIADQANVNLTLMLVFALLGGVILNAMPCVFPILSLKVLAIARKGGMSHRAIRLNGVAYTFGVLLSFWVLAVLLMMIQRAGAQVGWGFQMQSPLFVIGLALMLYLVGLNLSGLFHLPSLTVSGGQGKGDSVAGSLATGILATVVATPCTAPFMAAAVGFALVQPPLIALAIFSAVGLGLALPFLLISLFPRLVSFMPRPGHWMETFKQFLAFPMYASAAWLVWVASQQVDQTGLAFIFVSLVLLPFAVWLWHAAVQWPHPLRSALVLAAIVLVLFSAYKASLETARPALVAKEGHEAYAASRLDELRGQGKPVFVTATAAWCITCKYNEAAAIEKEEVQEAFRSRGITYLVADWTNQDEAITHFLEGFGRKGVPLYVYYPASGEPVVLPQILTPTVVLDYLNNAENKEP